MNATKEDNIQNFSFSKPAVYQIIVQGELDISLSGNLGGMQIKVISEDAKNPVTVMVGSVSDQAALSGILNSLYDMHFMVLSVKILEECGDDS